MLNLARLILAAASLLVLSNAFSQPVLDVNSVSGLQSLSPNISFLRYSEDLDLTPEQVLGAEQGEFQQLPENEMSFGYAADHFWFAIETFNGSSQSIELVLDTNVKFLTPLVIYEIDEEGARRELLFNDEHQVFENRPKLTPRLTVPLLWAPAERKLLLIHAKSGSGMDLRLQIGTSEQVAEKYATKLTFYSFLAGVLLSLVLINLFYFYAVRRVAHLHYAFQELSVLLFMMHIDGFAFQYLWPGSPVWNAHATMFFGHLIIVACSLFTISFLELKARAPVFYRLSQVVGAVAFITLLLTPIIQEQLSHQIGLIMIALGSIVFFAAGCYVSLGGYRPARYFVAGWFFMSLGAVIYGLANLGFLTLPIDPLFVLRAGVLLEGLLLSYGLSDQLKVLQERATQARENLLRSAEERLEEAVQHVKIQQENAEAKEALLRKDLEIARASHDIRQPISSLRMALLGLLRNQKDPATAEVFNRTLDHMEKVLGDRISLAANLDSAGEQTYGEFLEQLGVEFSAEASANEIKLRSAACSLPVAVEEVSLKRVVSNLLVNALRHSNGERVLMGVRRRPGKIEVVIADDGTGDFKRDSENSGSGLGLGIVRALCKENNWLLDIQSQSESGTYAKIGIAL